MSTITLEQSLQRFAIEPIFPELVSSLGLQGVANAMYPKLSALTSIVALEKFREVHNILGVVVIGSTAAGKTVLVQSVRHDFQTCPEIEIPKRFITRPPRAGDDFVENQHLTKEEFETKLQRKEIGFSWARHMEGTRQESYGFETTDPEKLAIYSANNDFVRRIQDLSKTILVVGVFAPDEVRSQRLLSRSPDMKVAEREYRLGDSSSNIIPFCHLLIKNFGEYERQSVRDVVSLIQIICKERLPWGRIRDLGMDTPIAQTRLFEVSTHNVLFSDGTIKVFESVSRSPGIRAFIRSSDSILLTKEWREEHGKWDYRLPGGKLFETSVEYSRFRKEETSPRALEEKAKETACREILEEVGMTLVPERMNLETLSKCGSIIDWDLYFFSVSVNPSERQSASIVTAESETVKNEWFTPEQVKDMCLSGAISEDRTVAFLLKKLLPNVMAHT
jgi:ribose 1,5-bisphosphokinase PhnN/8-oxo-dGTP pyrophosphatase MutT (NUDIX family)